VEPDQKLPKVLGVCAVSSRGMKRSQIIDLEQVLETINESLDGAERMAGLEVKQAYVSVAGSHISSLNSKGVVAVASPDQEISHEDVARVIEAARAISLPSDKEIIHVIPNMFKVDSQDGIKDPVGMTGVRLESETHIVTAMSTALRNIEKCIEDLGIAVSGFVFSGLAASEVVLSETEKELGVALVDIGAGSTSVCAFVDGALVYSVSVPIGARHLTQDIALGCRLSLDLAEKIKMQLSSEKLNMLKPHPGESKQEFSKRRKKADEIDLSELTNGENTEMLSKEDIVEGIMVPRMEEIFSLISEKLAAQDLLHDIPAGLVLTGGGAESSSIVQVAKDVLKLPARIGKPIELTGLTSDIQKPSYATSIGLLFYGKQQGGEAVAHGFSLPSLKFGGPSGKLFEKIGDLFKSLLP
ncbi:MAG: cell division protein FtsA, partial [Patescibacteria group bacterium]|nr:cell division protein FtsA [Patescibacteria group bacterium]